MNLELPSQKEQKSWKDMSDLRRRQNERLEHLIANSDALKNWRITTAQELQDAARELVEKPDESMEWSDIELLQVIKHFTDEPNFGINWNLPRQIRIEINRKFKYFSEREASWAEAKKE